MSELLSNSKRKYIENWRQSVSHHMESGTICRVTISEMTPEPSGYIASYIRPSKEHEKAKSGRSPSVSPEQEPSGHLPAVKFGYSHGNEELKKFQKQKNTSHHIVSRTVFPPSPNGMLVQNGEPDKANNDRRLNSLKPVYDSIRHKNEENNVADKTNSRDEDINQRPKKSSEIAKEIYDKYNMKAREQIMSAVSQFSMPWRNKTFLTLPVRFNDSARRKKIRYLVREKTSISSRKETLSSSLLTNESRYHYRDWEEENGG